MDIYIALLRSATSRRQSDAEFALNQKRVSEFQPDDDSYFAQMTARLCPAAPLLARGQ